MGLFDKFKKNKPQETEEMEKEQDNLTEEPTDPVVEAEIDKLIETVREYVANAPKEGPAAENMTEEEKRKQHNQQISHRFITRDDWAPAELALVTVQDLCILISNAKWAKEKGMLENGEEKLPERIHQFYQALVERLQEDPILYTVIDEATGYPYLDPDAEDCIWIFSQKEYAERAVEHYSKYFRKFRVEEVGRKERADFWKEAFFCNGAAGVYVDNGLCGCVVKPTDLTEKPDTVDLAPQEIPITNPEVMRAHLKMMQEVKWQVKYDKRDQRIKDLEREISRQLVNARFLLPVKDVPRTREYENQIVLGKEGTLSVVCLTGKDGTRALPVFTDWVQFKRCYSDEEYSGWVVSFDLLASMIETDRYEAFVINIGKCPAEFHQKNVERVRETLKAVSEKE